jgi:uncharacterized RDD family membrane protein YckC
MLTINVRTTQNVFIQYPLASVGERIGGYIIDLLVLIVYIIAIVALLFNIEVRDEWVYILMIGIPFLLYKALFEIFMDGQTPGKRLLNIKVVRLDGAPPTIGNYVIRWLFGIVEYNVFNGLIALLCVAAGGRGQRLGDMVGGTTVIKLVEQGQVTANQVFITPEESYQPTFSQVIQLTQNDIDLIQRALEVNRDQGNQVPLMTVAEKIKIQLGIQTDMPPIKMLYVLIKDYNYLNSQ